MGTLYIVATPIGNLEDISERAKVALSGADTILAEDTRVSKKLLDRLGLAKPLKTYQQHSNPNIKYEILKALVEGKNLALVSDAGTPGVSDPGNELIDFLAESSKEINIIPVPGPSAVSAALSVCGFNTSKYLFLGFWPKKKASKILNMLKNINMPFVYFDSPHRVTKNLDTISEFLGGSRRVFVARELTKLHETHYRGSFKQVITELKNEGGLRGEIVVVVE